MKTSSGFTLIEVLVSMAIFGVVLTVASELFTNANRYTTLTVSSADLEEDVRLSVLRMTEVTSQAIYLYPNNVTLRLKTGDVTTGKTALALLAPSGTPYCPAETAASLTQYCLFVYQTRPRSGYSSVLPKIKYNADTVLVEQRVRWVEWPVNQRPTTTFLTLTPTEGVVADAVDLNLTNLGQLELGRQRGVDAVLRSDVATDHPDALIQVARPVLAVQADQLQAQRSGYIFVRSIPRASPPGIGSVLP